MSGPEEPDKAIAADFRARLHQAFEPLAKIMNEARARGYEITFNTGPGPDGKQALHSIRILREL